MINITGISVCVNYLDFFKHCISNKEIFNKWIIITDLKSDDVKTFCEENGLICYQTDIFYDNGQFRKFAAINEALKLISEDEWVCFIDSDILLSPFAKRSLENLELDKTKIYGIDRLDCKGYDQYKKYLEKPLIIDNWLMTNGGLQLGARINHYYGEWGENGKFTGWKPLGFFQLCHKSKFKEYPEGSKDASHGDVMFAKLWDRKDRVMIPEIIGIHLTSEDSEWGSNWQGRTTNKFENQGFFKKLINKTNG